jgi:cellulose synthase/poly-beta-1,6-N-acetylglucosamine synthase-like glycosyltransferase
VIFLICVSVVLSLFYTGLMVYYTVGWKKLETFEVVESFSPTTYVSVIIPARNEEHNIPVILDHLLKQNYPRHLLDIVVVDDASTDNTAEVVKQFADKGVRLLRQAHTAVRTYKKQAIDYAISQCTSTIIITTDADCTMGEDWVRTIVAYQTKHKACFISSLVCMKPAVTLFQRLQTLEFAGLVGIGGAALQRKHPNMCNGANVAYLKEAYHAVNGFNGNDHIPSGDDEFLMHKMFKAFPERVLFLKGREAMVYTAPERSLSGFIQQRMRWVSKSTKYENKNITLILTLSYLFNVTLLLNFVGAFCFDNLLWLFLGQMGLKIVAEGIFLSGVTRFMKLGKLMWWFIPEQMLHVVYVVIIGLLGNLRPYTWKGRKV